VRCSSKIGTNSHCHETHKPAAPAPPPASSVEATDKRKAALKPTQTIRHRIKSSMAQEAGPKPAEACVRMANENSFAPPPHNATVELEIVSFGRCGCKGHGICKREAAMWQGKFADNSNGKLPVIGRQRCCRKIGSFSSKDRKLGDGRSDPGKNRRRDQVILRHDARMKKRVNGER